MGKFSIAFLYILLTPFISFCSAKKNDSEQTLDIYFDNQILDNNQAKIAAQIVKERSKNDLSNFSKHNFRITHDIKCYTRSYYDNGTEYTDVEEKAYGISTSIDYYSDTNFFNYESMVFRPLFLNTSNDKVYGNAVKYIVGLQLAFSEDNDSYSKELYIYENEYYDEQGFETYLPTKSNYLNDEKCIHYYDYIIDKNKTSKLVDTIFENVLYLYCDRTDELSYLDMIISGSFDNESDDDTSEVYIVSTNSPIYQKPCKQLIFKHNSQNEDIYDGYKIDSFNYVGLSWCPEGGYGLDMATVNKTTTIHDDGKIEEYYISTDYSRIILDYTEYDRSYYDIGLFTNYKIKEEDYYLNNNRFQRMGEITELLPKFANVNDISFAEKIGYEYLGIPPILK